MSSQALSSLLAVLCSNCSPVTGCKLGSVPTLWQTPLIRLAVMLRTSLCRMEGNPPLEQLSACSMENCWPQTQWEGRCCGRQPYRRHKASLKAPLCKANPCSEIGKAESQLDAPFSEQMVRVFCSLMDRFSFTSFAVLTSYCLWNFRALFLSLVWVAFTSGVYSSNWSRIKRT